MPKTARFTKTREWRPNALDAVDRTGLSQDSIAQLLANDEFAHDQWRWVLLADNGEPLSVSSEGYSDVRDAIHGFELTTGAAVEHEHRQVAVRCYTMIVVDDEPHSSRTNQVAEAIELVGLRTDDTEGN